MSSSGSYIGVAASTVSTIGFGAGITLYIVNLTTAGLNGFSWSVVTLIAFSTVGLNVGLFTVPVGTISRRSLSIVLIVLAICSIATYPLFVYGGAADIGGIGVFAISLLSYFAVCITTWLVTTTFFFIGLRSID